MPKTNNRKAEFIKSRTDLGDFYQECNNWIKFNYKFYIYGEGQGESFEEWQKEEILADLSNKLKEFCAKSKTELIKDELLEIYRNGYPSDSLFEKPKALKDLDVLWARLRITGKRRVIGFFDESDEKVSNVFYVVFLDKEHRFAPSRKKHT